MSIQKKVVAHSFIVLLFGMISAAQSSRTQSVALMAQVTPVLRIAVDPETARAASQRFSIVNVAPDEIEIELHNDGSSSDLRVPVVFTTNTRNYTVHASSMAVADAKIEVVSDDGSPHEFVTRPRPIGTSVTLAMARVISFNAPAHASVRIRFAGNRATTVRIRLKIRPLIT